MENEKWILRNDLIWFKPNVPLRPREGSLRLAHEHFFHFVKRPKEEGQNITTISLKSRSMSWTWSSATFGREETVIRPLFQFS